MPREEVEWYVEQCRDDAHQSCTYYSIVNIDQLHSPCSKQERTWTLTRTMSQQNKRYQTAIENIRLTTPMIELKNEKIKLDRSISLQTSSKEKEFGSTPQQAPGLLFNNSMRFMHVNGEFIVRI